MWYYYCEDPDLGGHDGQVLESQVGALQARVALVRRILRPSSHALVHLRWDSVSCADGQAPDGSMQKDSAVGGEPFRPRLSDSTDASAAPA